MKDLIRALIKRLKGDFRYRVVFFAGLNLALNILYAVVDTYTKIEDKFVDAYLTKDGENGRRSQEKIKKSVNNNPRSVFASGILCFIFQMEY